MLFFWDTAKILEVFIFPCRDFIYKFFMSSGKVSGKRLHIVITKGNLMEEKVDIDTGPLMT